MFVVQLGAKYATILFNLLAHESSLFIKMFFIAIITLLSSCDSNSTDDSNNESVNTIIPTNEGVTALIQGLTTIDYPENYNIAIANTTITDADPGFGLLSVANDENAPSSTPNFCSGSFAFVSQSEEMVVADGIGVPELSTPIAQQDVTINGRNAVEFLYIDLPDPNNNNDNVPLTALGRLYFFSASQTVFEENLEISFVCLSTDIGFAINEQIFRGILDSVEIN